MYGGHGHVSCTRHHAHRIGFDYLAAPAFCASCKRLLLRRGYAGGSCAGPKVTPDPGEGWRTSVPLEALVRLLGPVPVLFLPVAFVTLDCVCRAAPRVARVVRWVRLASTAGALSPARLLDREVEESGSLLSARGDAECDAVGDWPMSPSYKPTGPLSGCDAWEGLLELPMRQIPGVGCTLTGSLRLSSFGNPTGPLSSGGPLSGCGAWEEVFQPSKRPWYTLRRALVDSGP